MSHKHHFFNMQLTTTVSVALVLFLIGLECVLVLSARDLVKRVKENVSMTVVLNSDADTVTASHLQMMLDVVPYCLSYDYISKEQALEEHIRYLGEDPSKFLGYNPLSNAYELHLTEKYVHPDSMLLIEQRLMELPYVNKVVYQRDMLDLMNANIGDVSVFLLAIALILLFISQALMVNTIRLQIYSKRFLINTMTLVGATPWMIKAPFVRKNLLMAIVASALALLVLAFVIYYVNIKLGVMLFAITWQNIAFIVGVVVIIGILITLFASLFACGRYIRMKTDTMYTI